MGIKDNKAFRKFVRSRCVNKLGRAFLRFGNYIERVNYQDYRIEMQKRLSPANWHDDNSNGIVKINNARQTANKIKVRILHQQANMWNAVEVLCEELMSVKYFSLHPELGKVETQAEESYTSHNTKRLDIDGVVKKILTTDYVKEELEGIRHY